MDKSGYELDGFTLRPLLMDPEKGQWNGPDVAITALPGKDHSMNRVFDDAPFPHFSVRSQDWRYTLTSNGEEELYHYSNDPAESNNLADQAEYASLKEELKKKLIRLRDGTKWTEITSLSSDFPQNLELEFDYKNSQSTKTLSLRSGQTTAELPSTKHTWNRVRLRLDQNRREIWIKNKLHSDIKVSNTPGSLIQLNLDDPKHIKNIRMRAL